MESRKCNLKNPSHAPPKLENGSPSSRQRRQRREERYSARPRARVREERTQSRRRCWRLIYPRCREHGRT